MLQIQYIQEEGLKEKNFHYSYPLRRACWPVGIIRQQITSNLQVAMW